MSWVRVPQASHLRPGIDAGCSILAAYLFLSQGWAARNQTVEDLVGLFLAGFLAIALAGQRLLHAHLLAWLHVVRVPLDFLNNVFLLHLALEAAQCILQRFAFLNLYFCQMRLHLPTLRLDTL